jgi:hypothetical protein
MVHSQGIQSNSTPPPPAISDAPAPAQKDPRWAMYAVMADQASIHKKLLDLQGDPRDTAIKEVYQKWINDSLEAGLTCKEIANKLKEMVQDGGLSDHVKSWLNDIADSATKDVPDELNKQYRSLESWYNKYKYGYGEVIMGKYVHHDPKPDRAADYAGYMKDVQRQMDNFGLGSMRGAVNLMGNSSKESSAQYKAVKAQVVTENQLINNFARDLSKRK